MNTFLKHCRSLLNKKVTKTVIIGNESCDLDSAVCCLSLAFYLWKYPNLITRIPYVENVLPVLNVPREELVLKTEVVYYLKSNQINTEDLICRDEVNLENNVDNSIKFILVDHHITGPNREIIATVDHRPVDPRAQFEQNTFKFIELVGSCSSLVTKLIYDSENVDRDDNEHSTPLKLLYGAIILDTVNFSEAADKARALDHDMAKFIESFLKISNVPDYRDNLFKTLVDQRSAISGLDTYQILLKDLKLLSRNGRTVAIPGYPMLVQEYIKLQNSESNIIKFAGNTSSNVVVLMGMKVNNVDGSMRRDLGIINIDDSKLAEMIISKILTNECPSFQVSTLDCMFLNGTFLEQNNIKASRKQLLPLINECLDTAR
ncbi:exopolyphosphatase PRUNE1 [Uranotaenia lowii]|uniref:exopolyphosphatase PRUNE1 n=1 Tax=Uranotaenia lowii TaxID=190385 RepID=UPI002479D730|nr:exopolyphosphatase PRUNE1 [Uranotaenia lowii]